MSRYNKDTGTKLDVIIINKAIVSAWKSPPFQRPLRVNSKVVAVSEVIKDNGGVIPGIITIGILGDNEYLLDGQHRMKAWEMTELDEGMINVCYHKFDDMASMGQEFVELNGKIVNIRPDDILRGLEGTSSALKLIRKECGFVGYDQIRRNDHSPIVSMSQVLRCWIGSAGETPTNAAPPAAVIAKSFTTDDAEQLIDFLKICERAWGRESSFSRLWKGLNLTLCMWLYRRTVIEPYSSKTPKLSRENIKQCLMSLSADPDYLDWLQGRTLNDRERVSGYNRIKTIWSKRLQRELGKKLVYLPQPPWVHN